MALLQVPILPHDRAVVDALEAMPGDHPVGYVAAPPGALDGVLAGAGPDYVVVYPISGLRSGSLRDPYEDVDLVYQTTIVGRLPDGVRDLIDKVEAALADVTIPGRRVRHRVRPENVGDVSRDKDIPEPGAGPVFVATPRWRLFTTPA
jgi:hypothetical protein